MSWGLRWRWGGVQTQAQTWASVSPYADYNGGLIVLTGREGTGGGGVGVGGLPATAVQSHSTSTPSGAGQIYSSCLSGEQPSLSGSSLNDKCWEMKWHLHSLWGDEWFWSKDQIFLRACFKIYSDEEQTHAAWLKTLVWWIFKYFSSSIILRISKKYRKMCST